MIDNWNNLMIGDFLSLPRTEVVMQKKFPRFCNSHYQSGNMINQYWREPMLEYLLRYPYLRSALALDFYRIGFFQLVTYKKVTVSDSFLQFCTQALFASASNPFCILALVKGQTCTECEVAVKGAFVPVEGQTFPWQGLYDRCSSSQPYLSIWEAINEIKEGRWRVSHIGRWLRDKGFLSELKKISEWG